MSRSSFRFVESSNFCSCESWIFFPSLSFSCHVSFLCTHLRRQLEPASWHLTFSCKSFQTCPTYNRLLLFLRARFFFLLFLLTCCVRPRAFAILTPGIRIFSFAFYVSSQKSLHLWVFRRLPALLLSYDELQTFSVQESYVQLLQPERTWDTFSFPPSFDRIFQSRRLFWVLIYQPNFLQTIWLNSRFTSYFLTFFAFAFCGLSLS